MRKILLDTNAYSAFMCGDQAVFKYIVDSELVYVSTIVLGELYAGFLAGNRYAANVDELEKFLRKEGVQTLDVSKETSEIFGEIKVQLSKKGQMIPLNDIWIAAHSIETGSKLVTYDRHFVQISGLRIWEEIAR